MTTRKPNDNWKPKELANNMSQISGIFAAIAFASLIVILVDLNNLSSPDKQADASNAVALFFVSFASIIISSFFYATASAHGDEQRCYICLLVATAAFVPGLAHLFMSVSWLVEISKFEDSENLHFYVKTIFLLIMIIIISNMCVLNGNTYEIIQLKEKRWFSDIKYCIILLVPNFLLLIFALYHIFFQEIKILKVIDISLIYIIFWSLVLSIYMGVLNLMDIQCSKIFNFWISHFINLGSAVALFSSILLL